MPSCAHPGAALIRRAVASAAMLTAGLLLSAPAAHADTRIGEGRLFSGLAVSAREGGDIYVIDDGVERVEQYDPSKPPTEQFVRAFGWGIVPGAATGTGDLTANSNIVTDVVTTSGAFSESGQGGKLITGPGIPPGTTIARVGPSRRFNEELPSGVMELSNVAERTESDVSLSVAAGPGNVPTNERQQVVVDATGGNYTLTFVTPRPAEAEETTAELPFDAPASGSGSVQEALDALPGLGAGNVSVTGSPGGPYTVEFTGRFADVNVHHLSAESVSLTGGASEVTVTTSVEGGGALETCTTVCGLPSAEENAAENGQGFGGSYAGQLDYSEDIAVDNDPTSASYGDVYVVDQNNFRVEKYGPEGEFLLMFGGEVDKGPHHPGDLCTAAYLAEGDTCGAGVPGTAPAHFYREEPQTAAGGFKSWAQSGSSSIAVGPEGAVYVGDYGRIQEFTAGGVFAGEFAPPLAAGEEPEFVTALALDSSGDIFERSAIAESSTEVAGVREFSPAHTLLHTFDAGAEEAGSQPNYLALDSDGDLFVSDSRDGEPVFRAFRPSGALYAEFASDQVKERVRGLAVGDAANLLFASTEEEEGQGNARQTIHFVAAHPLPEPGPPVVEDEEAGDVEPETATLHAIVNPRELDTSYRLQWVTQQHFEAEGFANPQQTAPADLGSVWRRDPVQAAISNLAPATTYHWRVVATSSEGEISPETTFETLPDVSVRNFTTRTVAPEEVTLEAELDNNNSLQDGHWEICMGSEEGNYSLGCVPGILPAGSGAFEPVEAVFTGLQPHTEYHYRILVGNGYGHESSPDRTLTTEPSATEERVAEAAECPNVARREENDSTALPDCRAYEMVSPPFKAANAVDERDALAAGGERVYFTSRGSFSGSEQNRGGGYYVARRTASGWLTSSPIGPPAGPEYQPSTPLTFDAGLDTSLFTALPATSSTRAGNQPGQGPRILYLGLPDGSYLPASPPLSGAPPEEGIPIVGGSFDLSRVLLATRFKLLPSDPRANDAGSVAPDRLYELTGVGGPEPSLSLVAEVPSGLPTSCSLGTFGQQTDPLSADGSTLFYEAPVEFSPGGACGTVNPFVLYARVDEGPPIALSTPLASQCSAPSPCATAATVSPRFYGTSPDGDLAWFTTRQPLVDSDRDATENAAGADLYLAKLENGRLTELVQASHGEPSDPTPGEGAGVQGVVRVSQDGTHVAFVATGVLTAEANPTTGLEAMQGADNLYLYDATSGRTKFVADLCTGSGKSGNSPDASCPTGPSAESHTDSHLWTTDNAGGELSQAGITPDGRYLLFASYGNLTTGDTDSARDVFRYDFSTGQLIRISFGRDGNDGDGNDDAYNAEIPGLHDERENPFVMAEDEERAISADGAVAVFETAAPLVSSDVNAVTVAYGGALPTGKRCEDSSGCQLGRDVYEWEEDGHGTCHEAGGCIGLVSSGRDSHNTSGAVISSTGRDVTFVTPRSLVGADTDGVSDVYDAREDGGFPVPGNPEICRSAETCHGAGTSEQLHPRQTSEETQSSGNGPAQLACARGKHRVSRHGQVRCVPNRAGGRKKHHVKHSHKRAARHDRGGHR